MPYTIQELIAMDDPALAKAARRAFAMTLNPFSELGQREMRKRLRDAGCHTGKPRLSAAMTVVIGAATATIIDNILNYQEAIDQCGGQAATA